MNEAPGRSPLHRIIEIYLKAMWDLGHKVHPHYVERWGIAVHQCLTSRAREFHTHQHILDLVEDADPLEILAAFYHDTVYVQVDIGVPKHFDELLQPLLEKEETGYRIEPQAATDLVIADVLAVFGKAPNDILTPFTGLNELASAMVAAKELEGVLSRIEQVSIAACIEATISFRKGRAEQLQQRLLGMGFDAESVRQMVRRAVRMSNKDVGNFASQNPAYFLDNTWKLLPETNPALHSASTYTVRDYRIALQKMEGFLSKLPAELVFHAWDNEPTPDVHQLRVDTAARNIQYAVRYLHCKLYSTAVVEAIAEETGGDAPLELFMGGTPEPGGQPFRRIEKFLKEMPPQPVDAVLLGLLQSGRATSNFFDVAPSPVSTYLVLALGEEPIRAGVLQARDWWSGNRSALEFLKSQPAQITIAVAEAASHIVDTRAEALQALIRTLSA